MEEAVGLRYIIGNWYQENGGYVIVCAMFVAVVVWILAGGILYERRQKRNKEIPHSDVEFPKKPKKPR